MNEEVAYCTGVAYGPEWGEGRALTDAPETSVHRVELYHRGKLYMIVHWDVEPTNAEKMQLMWLFQSRSPKGDQIIVITADGSRSETDTWG